MEKTDLQARMVYQARVLEREDYQDLLETPYVGKLISVSTLASYIASTLYMIVTCMKSTIFVAM